MYLFPIRMLTGKNVVNWICIIRSSKRFCHDRLVSRGRIGRWGKGNSACFSGTENSCGGRELPVKSPGYHPAYIDDAAAAVAWVMKHIGEYGGDPTRVYVAGILPEDTSP